MYPSKKTVGTVYCRKNKFTIHLKSKKTMKYDISKQSESDNKQFRQLKI